MKDRSNSSTTKLHENAQRDFMKALMERKLRPGHLVSQREISELTGNSLPSVREALKLLEAEGIVKLVPKRGVEIREMKRKEIQDAFQIRRLIELEAIVPFVKKVSASEIAQLRRETQSLIDRAANDPKEELLLFQQRVELDHRLHRRIVASLENDLASTVHKNTETMMLLSRLSLPPHFHTSGPAFHEHLELLELIENGESEAAKESLREHLERACARAVSSAVP